MSSAVKAQRNWVTTTNYNTKGQETAHEETFRVHKLCMMTTFWNHCKIHTCKNCLKTFFNNLCNDKKFPTGLLQLGILMGGGGRKVAKILLNIQTDRFSDVMYFCGIIAFVLNFNWIWVYSFTENVNLMSITLCYQHISLPRSSILKVNEQGKNFWTRT